MRLNGNTVLITGGTSGIGYALARAFYEAGNRIFVTGRSSEKLDRLMKEHSEWMGLQADLARPDQIVRLVREVRKIGEPNVLVNNAGIQSQLDFLQEPREPEAILQEIRVNLEAPIRLIQEMLPGLLSQESSVILNVTSALGEVPRSTFPIYCASKAALSAYTMSLRHQLADTGVHVAELVPPFTDTPMNHGRDGQRVSAEVVAEAALEGLKHGARVIRPGKAALLHRIHRISPAFASKIVEAGP